MLCYVSYGFLSLLYLIWSPSLLVGEEIESQKEGPVYPCSTFTSANLHVLGPKHTAQAHKGLASNKPSWAPMAEPETVQVSGQLPEPQSLDSQA